LKRTLPAEEEKSNVLFHMGFDDRIVRRALGKVSGSGICDDTAMAITNTTTPPSVSATVPKPGNRE
jgi:hypothetical protein